MIILAHPTGNANVRAVLAGLTDAGLLHEFATTLGFERSAPWVRRVPARLKGEILRRAYDLPPGKIHARYGREALRLILVRGGLATTTGRLARWAGVDAVYRDLDRSVARRLRRRRDHGLRGVYAYEDGAAAMFAAAAELGLRRFYDLPIAYGETARRLIGEEALRWPEWSVTLGGMNDSPEKLEKKRMELELAEVVFCPSDFVAKSLPAWAGAGRRIVVAPFGSPVALGEAEGKREGRRGGGKLRVLFAGSLSQRKGLADLFAAVNLLGASEIELVVMGSLQAPLAFYRRLEPRFRYEPPRPHGEVLRLMRTCDVFVLPSIVEGRALVMQEAMSQGLPLLITANTGGEDLIETGRTGFLVPIRSPEVIAGRLAWFADHRAETRAMGEMARAKAAAYTWAGYGAAVAGAVERQLAPA